MNHRLHTDRLWLRPCQADDLAVLYALWTEEQVSFFLFDNRTITQDEAGEFIAQSTSNFAQRGYGVWLVGAAGDARIIGFAGLLGAGADVPHLLYGFAPEWWGRGYATEAARRVLAYAFDDLKLPEVQADVDAPNAASVRVLERLGMQRLSAPDAALLRYTCRPEKKGRSTQ